MDLMFLIGLFYHVERLVLFQWKARLERDLVTTQFRAGLPCFSSGLSFACQMQDEVQGWRMAEWNMKASVMCASTCMHVWTGNGVRCRRRTGFSILVTHSGSRSIIYILHLSDFHLPGNCSLLPLFPFQSSLAIAGLGFAAGESQSSMRCSIAQGEGSV